MFYNHFWLILWYSLVNYWYKMYLTFLLEHWEEITDELKEDFTLELDFRPLISLLGALFAYFWPSSSLLPVLCGFRRPFLNFVHSRNPQRWFFVSFRDKANVKYEWNFLICKYYLFYIFILLLTYSEHKRRTFENCQVRFLSQKLNTESDRKSIRDDRKLVIEKYKAGNE